MFLFPLPQGFRIRDFAALRLIPRGKREPKGSNDEDKENKSEFVYFHCGAPVKAEPYKLIRVSLGSCAPGGEDWRDENCSGEQSEDTPFRLLRLLRR